MREDERRQTRPCPYHFEVFSAQKIVTRDMFIAYQGEMYLPAMLAENEEVMLATG